MAAILMWGISIVLALQALSTPALDNIFLAITQLGSELFFLLLVPLIYWCFDKRFGIRLAILFLLSAIANIWLKALFNTPRPYQYDSRVRLIGPDEMNPGFPSGHAQTTTTVWGELGLRIRRGWMWALAIVVVVAVSISRVYLGVHFPHDVAGGIVFGAIAIALFVWLEPVAAPRLAALSFGAQLAASILVPVVLIPVLIGPDSVAALGMLAGLASGYVIQCRYVNFSAGGATAGRALRFVVGLIGTLVIYLGLRVVFGALAKDEGTALWYALRFVRYGLTGLWVGELWPALAAKTGLAVREER